MFHSELDTPENIMMFLFYKYSDYTYSNEQNVMSQQQFAQKKILQY